MIEPSIKFTGHSHTPQRRCSDSYWSIGPVINNLLLDQTDFYWSLPHVRPTSGMTEEERNNQVKLLNQNRKFPCEMSSMPV